MFIELGAPTHLAIAHCEATYCAVLDFGCTKVLSYEGTRKHKDFRHNDVALRKYFRTFNVYGSTSGSTVHKYLHTRKYLHTAYNNTVSSKVLPEVPSKVRKYSTVRVLPSYEGVCLCTTFVPCTKVSSKVLSKVLPEVTTL